MKVCFLAAGDVVRLAAPFRFVPAHPYWNYLLRRTVGDKSNDLSKPFEHTFPAGQEFTVLGVYMNRHQNSTVRLQTRMQTPRGPRKPYVWMTKDEINQMEIA